MTNVAVKAVVDDVVEPPKRITLGKGGRVELAEQSILHTVVWLPPDVRLEDVVDNPDAWKNVQNSDRALHKWSLVTVIEHDDGRALCGWVVTHVDHNGVLIRPNRGGFIDGRAQDSTWEDDDKTVRIEFRGSDLWCIVNQGSGAAVQSGLATKPAAIAAFYASLPRKRP